MNKNKNLNTCYYYYRHSHVGDDKETVYTNKSNSKRTLKIIYLRKIY